MTDDKAMPPLAVTAAGAGAVAAHTIGGGAIVQTGANARAVRLEPGTLLGPADLEAPAR
jgi:hypothetical protein